MQLNKNDMALKQEYEDCLKKCVCLELVQIKEYTGNKPDSEAERQQSSKATYLEVRTTRSSAANNSLSSNILFVGQM